MCLKPSRLVKYVTFVKEKNLLKTQHTLGFEIRYIILSYTKTKNNQILTRISCVFYNHYVKTKYVELLQHHQKFTATFNKKKNEIALKTESFV